MISAENKRVTKNIIAEMLHPKNPNEELKLVHAVTRFRIIKETKCESTSDPATGKLLFEHSAEPSVTGVTSDSRRSTGCKVRISTNSNERLFKAEEGFRMRCFPIKSFTLF